MNIRITSIQILINWWTGKYELLWNTAIPWSDRIWQNVNISYQGETFEHYGQRWIQAKFKSSSLSRHGGELVNFYRYYRHEILCYNYDLNKHEKHECYVKAISELNFPLCAATLWLLWRCWCLHPQFSVQCCYDGWYGVKSHVTV